MDLCATLQGDSGAAVSVSLEDTVKGLYETGKVCIYLEMQFSFLPKIPPKFSFFHFHVSGFNAHSAAPAPVFEGQGHPYWTH